jgi:hypothetical protein
MEVRMSRLACVAVIAALGLTGCGWTHRDRNAGSSTERSGTSAEPTMRGTDQDTMRTPPEQQKRLQEEQTR